MNAASCRVGFPPLEDPLPIRSAHSADNEPACCGVSQGHCSCSGLFKDVNVTSHNVTQMLCEGEVQPSTTDWSTQGGLVSL